MQLSKLGIIAILLSAAAFGQGTTPTTGAWTKITPASGYPVFTIAQFDRSSWIPTRGCYALWGQYKSATFSEENDALGCFSYAEKQWHMILQSSSQHSVHRPQTGHQWGYQEYIPSLDSMLWVANSGAQGLEEQWVLNKYDFAANLAYDIPVFSVSSVLTRPWINSAGTLSGYSAWDSTHGVLTFFPDNSLSTGRATVCNLSTMVCTTSATTNGPTAIQAVSDFRFDPDDGFTYWYGGGQTILYKFNAGSPASGWTPLSSATCTGAGCVSGHPLPRLAPGLSYSTTDHKFLFAGGVNQITGTITAGSNQITSFTNNGDLLVGMSITEGSCVGCTAAIPVGTVVSAIAGSTITMSKNATGTGSANVPVQYQALDVWTFDPAAGSGVGAWSEVCSQFSTPCGSPTTGFPVFTSAREGDRLEYDAADNVFIISDDNGAIWVFPLTAATGNYGRSIPSYGVPTVSSPFVGPLNRTTAPASPSASNAETGAFDLSVDSAGGAVYLAHVEPTIPSDLSTCNIPVPYIWSSTASGNWLPGGTQASACAAIGNGSLLQPSGHPYHAKVGSTEWEAHDKRNWSGLSSNGKAVAQSYNGTTWSGGDIGCVTATCFSIGSTRPQNSPRALINANGTPTVMTFEFVSTFNQLSDVFVQQWNGTSWVSTSSTTPLNVLSLSHVTYGSLAADPSGNLMACWTEEVDASSRVTMTTTPQLYCKYYNGSTWATVGGGSLNRSASAWARSPSVVYASGTWYVGYTEQTQTGLPKLFIYSCPTSGSCTLLTGSSINNNGSTGLAFHPSLAADSTTLVVAWEEQSAAGQKTLGYIQKWNGSSFTSVASGISAVSGSVLDIGATVATAGTVTAAWTEATWGNLTQIFMASYSLGSTCSITTLGLPDGFIGAAYSQQIGTANCTAPTFTVSAGSLPTGLSLSSGGLISGTPTTAQSSSFTVSVTDAGGNPSQALGFAINTPSVFVPITVQELICSGCSAGIARTNEPFTMGFPLPDSAGITSTSGLNLIGASAAQFSSEGVWPSGNLKWVKIRAILPSLTAGGTATVTFTNVGPGNFGGSNLATDNGTTITVSTNGGTCGAGSAICFTIKKANFNVIDQMQIGSTTMVTSGASTGLVVMGPTPTATYPGNVTCSPTAGGTACTVAYTTANDASSTCSIEENGPAIAVLKCTADLNDGAGHVYMHTTARLYFTQGRSSVKATVILRNADLGTSSTFASATKGHQGFELRVTPNLTGTLTYTIANHTGTPTTGTLNQAGGTDYAYIYQANSNLLKQNNQCTSPCVNPASISGYAIINNGTASLTGSATQYPVGWAEIADSGNRNMVIGYEQMAGYQNKSLEFRSGGADVRVGMWAGENNTTSVSTLQGVADKPYYQAWPQYSTHNVFLEFNTAQPTSAQNDFLTFQYPITGRADYTWYNSASVFPYPMLGASEEDSYYSSTFAAASPSVTARTPSDLVLGNTSNADVLCEGYVCVFNFYSWAATGGGNQMEFRLAHIFDWIRRGYPAGLLQTGYFYKFMADWSFPRSDGFSWAGQSATQYYDYPTATSTNSSLATCLWNCSGHGSYLENDGEHANGQGLPEYYFVSGDETFKDAAIEYGDVYKNTSASSSFQSLTPAASIWNDRSIGNVLFAGYELFNFFNATGDTASANTIKTNMESVYTSRLHPALCSYAGYPSGCTPDVNDNTPQVGTSLERGLSNIFKDTSMTAGAACSGTIQASPRTAVAFMASRKLEGMYLLHQMETSAWQYYNEEWDRAYGSALWALSEMYKDNGTTSFTGNGFRYKQAFDYPNSCADTGNVVTDNFSVGNDQTIWFHWFVKAQYEGQMSATSQRQLAEVIQFDSSVSAFDEFFHFTAGAPIYLSLHNGSTPLLTVPLSGFTDNGGGSYTISWTVPNGATSYRVKWGSKQIVDWIGFNAATYSFIGNPATSQNWFASTEASGIPSPATSGTTQSMTISTGQTGLTSANFMVKSFATSLASPSATASSVVSGAVKVGGNASIH